MAFGNRRNQRASAISPGTRGRGTPPLHRPVYWRKSQQAASPREFVTVSWKTFHSRSPLTRPPVSSQTSRRIAAWGASVGLAPPPGVTQLAVQATRGSIRTSRIRPKASSSRMATPYSSPSRNRLSNRSNARSGTRRRRVIHSAPGEAATSARIRAGVSSYPSPRIDRMSQQVGSFGVARPLIERGGPETPGMQGVRFELTNSFETRTSTWRL